MRWRSIKYEEVYRKLTRPSPRPELGPLEFYNRQTFATGSRGVARKKGEQQLQGCQLGET